MPGVVERGGEGRSDQPGGAGDCDPHRRKSIRDHGQFHVRIGMDVEAIVARVWPGEEPRVEVLGGGITNHNFKVDAVGGPYVLRIAGRDTDALGIDRSVEHEAALAAAAVGVGPEVVTFVEPEGYLVTRFIEGSIVPLEDMREPEWIKRVAQALRAVHRGPVAAGALQLVSGRRGLPDDGVRTRRRGSAELRVGAPGGAARRAGAGCVRRASVSQRPPQRELHRRRPAPPDRRLGVRGHGRRLLRSRELLDQPRARPRRPRGAARGLLRRAPSRRTSARSS